MPVSVVTDSTAYLPAEVARGITVVPLTVALGGVAGIEGEEITPAKVAAALTEHRLSVSTSRPAPEQFAQIYRKLLAGGADGIASVHLSARLSGTCDAARAAAAAVDPARLAVVGARGPGVGLGLCARRAADEAAAGATRPEVAAGATAAAAATSTLLHLGT